MNMSYMMEDEINSQASIIENLISRYILNYCVLVDITLDIKRIVLVASGSSYNAAVFGKYFFENISNVEAICEYASEFAHSCFMNLDKNALYVFISQSGNSIDTVLAMEKVKEHNLKTLCITNNKNSKLYNECDYKLDIEAGRENAIAATKTFGASVVMLWLIALKIAQNNKVDISSHIENISLVKKNIENTLLNIENIDVVSKVLSKQDGFSICGFNKYFPLALEAALKIKETCYINTCPYPLGEFIHGYFAVLNKSKYFLIFLTSDCTNIERNLLKKIIKTYKIKSIVVSDEYEDYDCDMLLKFPKCQSKIATIVSMIIVVQMLALKMALRLRRNVDKPQGLNKVVDDKDLK